MKKLAPLTTAILAATLAGPNTGSGSPVKNCTTLFNPTCGAASGDIHSRLQVRLVQVGVGQLRQINCE